jgi:transcriptional regulator with XRE-family HTH domain
MFAERLKKLREENRYNQEYVADYLGVKQQTYSRYENNVSEPDIITIQKLTALFKVSSDYLLGLSEFRQGNLNQLPDEIKEEVKNFIGYLLDSKKRKNE